MNKKASTAPLTAGSTKKLRNDIILISALLLTVLIAALALFLLRVKGDTVTVSVDGKLFGEYSLGDARVVEIQSGDGYNILVIEDGKAYIRQASCPDGICSSHRPIGHGGESIICLPNKVVIEVHTQDQRTPDVIS
ncbi:MAG: NusG domain II-containing protein [Ruminococcaceae bacterium]|nr:NusG domain II-containing protein [Oscillospiraceae bacterium]